MAEKSEHPDSPIGIESLTGGNGARYRVRTCDPYRVKVMLYH